MENIDSLNEPVVIKLPRGAWNTVLQIIWEHATCKIGNPLIEAMRSQLENKDGSNTVHRDIADANGREVGERH